MRCPFEATQEGEGYAWDADWLGQTTKIKDMFQPHGKKCPWSWPGAIYGILINPHMKTPP